MTDLIKRYGCTNGGFQYCYGCYQMEEEDDKRVDGNYVKAEDYDALRQQLEEAQANARLGAHVKKWASEQGWVEGEEGADMFMQRVCYSTGWDDYHKKNGSGHELVIELTERVDKAEQRLAGAGQEAVAWGIPNSRPTERNPLMQVLLDNTSCQYPELLIPLYLHPAPPATDERVRLDALRWNILVEAVESGGMTIAMENGTQGTIRLGKGNLQHGIDAALTEQAEAYEQRIRELQAKAVPEGWKLVPMKPNDSMIRAGTNAALAVQRNSSHPVGGWSVYGTECYSAMLAAAPAPAASPVAELEPVTGDILPKVGSRVLIHLGRQDEWVEHTVTGYYVWGDARLHRVFVRVVDDAGYSNSRMLHEVRPVEAALPASDLSGSECGNCFEGKSDLDHECQKCGGTGEVKSDG